LIFDPVPEPVAAVGAVAVLGDQSLQPHQAGMAEQIRDDLALFNVAERDPIDPPRQKPEEVGLAHAERRPMTSFATSASLPAPPYSTAPCASVLGFGPREKAGGQRRRPSLATAPASPVPLRFHASKSDLNIIEILRCECEPHHCWAEPDQANLLLQIAFRRRPNMAQVYFHCSSSGGVWVDRSGQAVSDLAEARDRAACIV
jgi:hypothetical protein